MDSTVFNEALIAAVKKRQPVYDKNDDNYYNRAYVNKQWQEIAEEIGTDDQTARKKWTVLRDYFQRTNRHLTTSSTATIKTSQSVGSGVGVESTNTNKLRKWYMYDSLRFLLPHLHVNNSKISKKRAYSATTTHTAAADGSPGSPPGRPLDDDDDDDTDYEHHHHHQQQQQQPSSLMNTSRSPSCDDPSPGGTIIKTEGSSSRDLQQTSNDGGDGADHPTHSILTTAATTEPPHPLPLPQPLPHPPCPGVEVDIGLDIPRHPKKKRKGNTNNNNKKSKSPFPQDRAAISSTCANSNSNSNSIDEMMLEAIASIGRDLREETKKKSAAPPPPPPPPPPHSPVTDEDELFCRSLVSKFKCLEPFLKLECQAEVQLLILRYMRRSIAAHEPQVYPNYPSASSSSYTVVEERPMNVLQPPANSNSANNDLDVMTDTKPTIIYE